MWYKEVIQDLYGRVLRTCGSWGAIMVPWGICRHESWPMGALTLQTCWARHIWEFSCEGLSLQRWGVDACEGRVGRDDPRNRLNGWAYHDLSETHNGEIRLVGSTSQKGHDGSGMKGCDSLVRRTHIYGELWQARDKKLEKKLMDKDTKCSEKYLGKEGASSPKEPSQSTWEELYYLGVVLWINLGKPLLFEPRRQDDFGVGQCVQWGGVLWWGREIDSVMIVLGWHNIVVRQVGQLENTSILCMSQVLPSCVNTLYCALL